MDDDQKWMKKASLAFQTRPEPVTQALLERVKSRVEINDLDAGKYQEMLLGVRAGKYEGQQMSVAAVASLISHSTNSGDSRENKSDKPAGPASPK